MHAGERTSSGYWYPIGAPSSVDVLNLLRRYREAERAMRQRTRDSMGMGETDLVAIRTLLQAQRRGELVRQRDLARSLGISGASVTALVDRLVASGHIERLPHPSDGRAVVLVATESSDREVRETLGIMHRRMLEVVDDLDDDERAVVARFLAGLTDAVDAAREHVDEA